MIVEDKTQCRKGLLETPILEIEKNKLINSIYLLLQGPTDSLNRQIAILKALGMVIESGHFVIQSFTGHEIFRTQQTIDETSLEATLAVLEEALDFVNKYPSLCVLITFAQSDWEMLIAISKNHRVDYLLKLINWPSDDIPTSGDMIDIWFWYAKQKALLTSDS